jgi:hypothetical protein
MNEEELKIYKNARNRRRRRRCKLEKIIKKYNSKEEQKKRHEIKCAARKIYRRGGRNVI